MCGFLYGFNKWIGIPDFFQGECVGIDSLNKKRVVRLDVKGIFYFFLTTC